MASICTNCRRTRVLAALQKTSPVRRLDRSILSRPLTIGHFQLLETLGAGKSSKRARSRWNVCSQSTIAARSVRNDDPISAMLKGDNRLMSSNQLPSEAVVLQYLKDCEELAQSVADKPQISNPKVNRSGRNTPASSLLSLNEQSGNRSLMTSEAKAIVSTSKRERRQKISQATHNAIINPKVFVTAKILDKYVSIQSMLRMPESFGEVFQLYANKPVPQPRTLPVQYTIPNPNKAASAVPLATAVKALDSAIETKNLGLCIDIIKASVCTTAFKRAKLLRKAGIPGAAAILAPFAAYTLASQLSLFQDTMSSEMATNVAFAGILSYVGFTAIIGIVAITTANDQMERVSWATGTPLRERWLREEERAMADRVAEAWGFKEKFKRGEEEGREWEALREWIGLRGMVLDKVALMEGME
ncbi:MAG: hypothetical protein MMC33_008325 [Icmadophila ericetorum]|nr:hypothetical protein [Icmadophila ericetorum]